MIHSPKISVILPIYGVEHCLPQCIDSILNQTFTDFELLLIDDGSPDNSGNICDEYALKDNRIRVFHKENGGVSSARNWGIDKARGEWIYFSDSDDELYPNALEILTKYINQDIAYVMAGYNILNEDREEIYSIDIRKVKIINNQEAISQMFLPEDYKYHGYLWNKLFKLSLIKQNKLLFDENIYFNEDRLFNVLYLIKLANHKCFYTTEPVYKYFERGIGAIASLNKAYNPKFQTDLAAFLQMLAALQPSKNKKNIELCKRASYNSYRYNIYLMKKFKSYNKVLDKQMYNNLCKQISIIDIVYIRLGNIIRLIKSKLKS